MLISRQQAFPTKLAEFLLGGIYDIRSGRAQYFELTNLEKLRAKQAGSSNVAKSIAEQ